MRALVDTSVLSLVFRRSRPDLLGAADRATINRFRQLSSAAEDAIVLIGAIRQEILSGVRVASRSTQLRSVLDGFQYLPTDLPDHDAAADGFNRCQARGIAADPIDILICASAHRHGLPVFTVDGDFARYATAVPFKLYHPLP